MRDKKGTPKPCPKCVGYKMVRPDGTAFHDSTTKYEVGAVLSVKDATADGKPCGHGARTDLFFRVYERGPHGWHKIHDIGRKGIGKVYL